MTIESDELVSAYFLSFVEPSYSRSGTLFNAHSKHLQKEYIKVSSGWRKIFLELLSVRRSINKHSVVIVMSPAQKIAPLARRLLKQKIILDAGWPLTDGIVSRGINLKKIPMLLRSYFIDFISFHSVDLILVESQAQLKRISRLYVVPRSRLRVSYTGVNEMAFSKPLAPSESYSHLKEQILKNPKKLNMLFRGSINNESGMETILSAANMLVGEINLIIIANRNRLPAKISNNCFVFSRVTEEEMRDLYELSDITLGQISRNKRLRYTIPHKAFEAGYFAKAYITPRANGIAELYSQNAVPFLDEVNVKGLVEKIRFLYNKEIRSGYEQQIFKEYSQKMAQTVLISHFEKEVLAIMRNMNL